MSASTKTNPAAYKRMEGKKKKEKKTPVRSRPEERIKLFTLLFAAMTTQPVPVRQVPSLACFCGRCGGCSCLTFTALSRHRPPGPTWLLSIDNLNLWLLSIDNLDPWLLSIDNLDPWLLSIWRCEHARFCVEVFYALYINFYSFIHSFIIWTRGCCPSIIWTRGCCPSIIWTRGCCPSIIWTRGCCPSIIWTRGCCPSIIWTRGCVPPCGISSPK